MLPFLCVVSPKTQDYLRAYYESEAKTSPYSPVVPVSSICPPVFVIVPFPV